MGWRDDVLIQFTVGKFTGNLGLHFDHPEGFGANALFNHFANMHFFCRIWTLHYIRISQRQGITWSVYHHIRHTTTMLKGNTFFSDTPTSMLIQNPSRISPTLSPPGLRIGSKAPQNLQSQEGQLLKAKTVKRTWNGWSNWSSYWYLLVGQLGIQNCPSICGSPYGPQHLEFGPCKWFQISTRQGMLTFICNPKSKITS